MPKAYQTLSDDFVQHVQERSPKAPCLSKVYASVDIEDSPSPFVPATSLSAALSCVGDKAGLLR